MKLYAEMNVKIIKEWFIMKGKVPYGKLSKKQKRTEDQRRRRDWGAINPITRRKEDSKAYNRNSMKRFDDSGASLIFQSKWVNFAGTSI